MWELDFSNWALHLANVLILCSFLVKDILFLRLLSIVAGAFFCLYFWKEDMIDPVIWNVLFSLVNIFQVGRLWFQRRKIPLNSEEQFLRDQFFPNLHAKEIKSLFQCGQTGHISQGADVVHTTGLTVSLQGQLHLQHQHQDLLLRPGQFIGVRTYLTQQQSEQRGQAHTDVDYLQWNATDLQGWTSVSADRHNLLLSALSKDLISKIPP